MELGNSEHIGREEATPAGVQFLIGDNTIQFIIHTEKTSEQEMQSSRSRLGKNSPELPRQLLCAGNDLTNPAVSLSPLMCYQPGLELQGSPPSADQVSSQEAKCFRLLWSSSDITCPSGLLDEAATQTAQAAKQMFIFSFSSQPNS